MSTTAQTSYENRTIGCTGTTLAKTNHIGQRGPCTVVMEVSMVYVRYGRDVALFRLVRPLAGPFPFIYDDDDGPVLRPTGLARYIILRILE